MSSSSPEMNLRSRTREIKGRKSIKKNAYDAVTKENSPFTYENYREFSTSPNRKENLYPDLREFNENENEDLSDSNNDHEEVPVVECDTSVNRQNYNNLFLLVCIVMLVISVLLIFFMKFEDSQQSANISVNKIDCSTFIELGEKYSNQNAKIFKSLKVATENLYNRKPSRPSIFAFFSTDQYILDALSKDIAEVTKRCINQSTEPINLKNSDFNREKFLRDHTKIISEYKSELSKRTIMVINNLDGISTSILPSLHSFTDTYNPLVQKSIIYFTIKVPQKPTGKHIDYIFTHLQQKWSDLPNNVRDPLITRILDQTFFLEPSY